MDNSATVQPPTSMTLPPIPGKSRPISESTKPVQMLIAFRGALRDHKSLLDDGTVHANITNESIRIPNDPDCELDNSLAYDPKLSIDILKEFKRKASNYQKNPNAHQVLSGLPSNVKNKYVAAQLLVPGRNAMEPTYRHDLESFFYVFLEYCLKRGAIRTVPNSQLENLLVMVKDWETSHPNSVYESKIQFLQLPAWSEPILADPGNRFCVLHNLLRRFRLTLFDTDVGTAPFTGTRAEKGELYGRIIGAFEDTIDQIRKIESNAA